MNRIPTTRKPLPVWLTIIFGGVVGLALAALYSFRLPDR